MVCELKQVEHCSQCGCYVVFDEVFKALHHDGSEFYRTVVIEL